MTLEDECKSHILYVHWDTIKRIAKKQFNFSISVNTDQISTKIIFPLNSHLTMISTGLFFAEVDSLHLGDTHYTSEGTKGWGRREISMLSGELLPLHPTRLKDLGSLRHILHLHVCFRLQSCQRLMLYIFLLSLTLHIFIDKESQREIRRQFKA